MATKRRRIKKTKSRKSCKHGKLKKRVKTKSGRKRRCKKKKKSRRKKRSYKFTNCNRPKMITDCKDMFDPIAYDDIPIDANPNNYVQIDDKSCISTESWEDLKNRRSAGQMYVESPMTRENIWCEENEPTTVLASLPPHNPEETFLMAAENGNINRIIMLLDSNDVTIDELDSGLIYASEWGHIEIVKLLIDEGADVNYKDYPNEDEERIPYTALRYACSNGHIEIVKILIDEGADIFINWGIDKGMHTPIYDAYIENHANIIRLLLRKGAILPRIITEEVERGRERERQQSSWLSRFFNY